MQRNMLTSVATVDVKVLWSYTHPFWHWTVAALVMLEELDNSWYWGSGNISQELGPPSSCCGILTTSLCSWVRFPKMPPSSRPLTSQWWEGIAAMKLFSKKWHGRDSRDMLWIRIIMIWYFPQPLISERMLSNFIFKWWFAPQDRHRHSQFIQAAFDVDK